MKKLIIVFVFLLLACSPEKQDSAKEEQSKVNAPADWIFLDGSYSWGDALNACPAGYHLPDKFEWDNYIVHTADIPNYKYWTSSYNVGYTKEYSVAYVQDRKIYSAFAYDREYSVACKKDEKLEAKSFLDKIAFTGTAYVSKKKVDCLEGRKYIGFEDNSLYLCENRTWKRIDDSLDFLQDSLEFSADTVVLNLRHMIPCTFGMNGKKIMTGVNRYMYQCYDYNWHGLGYAKLNPVQLGYYKDSLTGVHFKTIIIDSMEWSSQNIYRSMPGEECYENKKMHCENHGRLYGENAREACPADWRLPRRSDWVTLFGRFGLDGAYLRSKDDWFLDFKENKDVGFTIYPAGYLDNGYKGFGMVTGWWSYDDENRLYAILFDGEKFCHDYAIENKKFYIRCVRKRRVE
jgi:uncharacterized protein (TIGR02145 family)